MQNHQDPLESLRDVDRRQDQLLQQLDELNQRVEAVLASYLSDRGGVRGAEHNTENKPTKKPIEPSGFPDEVKRAAA